MAHADPEGSPPDPHVNGRLGAAGLRWIVWLGRHGLTMGRRHLAPLVRVLRDRSSRHARFWLQLMVGTLVLVGAAWLFGAIAEDVVTGDPLTIVDRILADWLHAQASPSFTRAMLLATGAGGSAVVTGVTLATALLLVFVRRWHWLLELLLAVPGGALLNQLLKIAFQRARPELATPFLVFTDYGFPSGHTMMATVLYGWLAVLGVRTCRAWRGRGVIVGIACALILLVGFTRMYLGAHYLSDILAAITAGVAWLMLCLTTVATLRYRARS